MGCSSSKQDSIQARGSTKPGSQKADDDARSIKFHKKYDLQEVLGEGSFSIVYAARTRETGKTVAIKKLSKKKMSSPHDEACFRAECEILRSLNHPHVVKCFDMMEDKYNMYMVLEYLNGGELFDRILEKSNYSEVEGREVSRRLLESIKHLHDMNIVHRDLKPENILLADRDSDTNIKIVDFGFAVKVTADGSGPALRRAGTPAYVAPEVIDPSDVTGDKANPPLESICEDGPSKGAKERGGGRGAASAPPAAGAPVGDSLAKASDMWSIGVIIFMLLSGYPPFFEENIDSLFRKILAAEYVLHPRCWEHVSPEGVELVKGLLCRNPYKRLTVQQALSHPWFNVEKTSLAAHKLSTVVTLRENRDALVQNNMFHKKEGSWAAVLNAFSTGTVGQFAASAAANLASSAAEGVVAAARSISSNRIEVSRKYSSSASLGVGGGASPAGEAFIRVASKSSGFNLINVSSKNSSKNVMSQAKAAAENIQSRGGRGSGGGTPSSRSRSPAADVQSAAQADSAGATDNSSNQSSTSSIKSGKQAVGSGSGCAAQVIAVEPAADESDDGCIRISLDRRPGSGNFRTDPVTGKICQLQPASAVKASAASAGSPPSKAKR